MTNSRQTPPTNSDATQGLPQHEPNRRLGQLKLLALFGIAIAPVFLAAFMYFGNFGVPDTSTNNGTLVLPPLQAETVPELTEIWQRETMKQADDKPKWLLSVVGDTRSQPDEALERDEASLYLARQVTVAVGKDQNRIGYGWLQQGGTPESSNSVVDRYADLQLVSIGSEAEAAIQVWLDNAGISAQPGDFVLADPNGNFIMHYPKATDGKAILEDLKRLLKVSKIG
ncbi:MAG: hypothetical protein CME36_13935 [unclassified Hahellaceae]|nr:hypothetical protein [Hahellaceae bacterium]|tara:strand:- start:20563 stop:21243 length:681 start_codon:yes stop_codon:yes gene_type:complete